MILDSVTYQGFESPSAEPAELLLGRRFVSHVPSKDQIIALGQNGEIIISKGEKISLVLECHAEG